MSGDAADDSLLEQFTCPVCFMYMDKKIYICINGHSHCEGCNSRLLKCPVCNVKMNPSRRNITLEQAAKKVKEWKAKQESGKIATCAKGVALKRKTRASLGSPIRAHPADFLTENQIQCPVTKCCYFTRNLLQLKIHLQSWHADQLYLIKNTRNNPSEGAIRVRLYWDLNSLYNMFVLTASDTFFVVYIIRTSCVSTSTSHIINVLTVSNKTSMFKYTCGNISKFSMFYQGRHQAQDGIEVDNKIVDTLKRGNVYKNYIQIYITKVAALHAVE